jgi:hypothetical protein
MREALRAGRARQVCLDLQNSAGERLPTDMNAVQRGSTFLISLLFLGSGLLFLRSALGGLRVDALGSIDVVVGATLCSVGLALAYFGFSAARKIKVRQRRFVHSNASTERRKHLHG